MAKIGFALTGSFCTIKDILIQMELLKELGHDVIPITSSKIVTWDTRFGEGKDIKLKLKAITGYNPITTIIEAEKFGSQEPLDLLVVAPATGNFIGKFASGITDNVVCMTAKATLRNNKPVVIAVSTNDGLSANGENIMKLYNRKNIYFVPFGQDDPDNKNNSLIAHYDLLIPTINKALLNNQLQPVLKGYIKE
ncbi:MAG: dipicolinate synthase subunit B [Bacilli bacterium]